MYTKDFLSIPKLEDTNTTNRVIWTFVETTHIFPGHVSLLYTLAAFFSSMVCYAEIGQVSGRKLLLVQCWRV